MINFAPTPVGVSGTMAQGPDGRLVKLGRNVSEKTKKERRSKGWPEIFHPPSQTIRV